MSALLEVKNLKTYFFTKKGIVKAVDDVSFEVREKEILGIVGESGAGKSITGFSILKAIDPPGKIVGGSILFKGEDLVPKSEDEMQRIRGNHISMVFQDPLTSLNPVFTIGYQLEEAIKVHNPDMSKDEVRSRSIELLKSVGIPSPEKRLKDYPHQFSGGMRQRVVIAIALANNPDLVIADEPTTALDVTIQAQVLNLMKRLSEERGSSIILITHDMGVVAQMADRIAVMYAGKIVEIGPTEEIIFNPRHPYTIGLIRSIPKLSGRRGKKLYQIPGMMPSLLNLPPGCAFAPRCFCKTPICEREVPRLEKVGDDHYVRCFNHRRIADDKQSCKS